MGDEAGKPLYHWVLEHVCTCVRAYVCVWERETENTSAVFNSAQEAKCLLLLLAYVPSGLYYSVWIYAHVYRCVCVCVCVSTIKVRTFWLSSQRQRPVWGLGLGFRFRCDWYAEGKSLGNTDMCLGVVGASRAGSVRCQWPALWPYRRSQDSQAASVKGWQGDEGDISRVKKQTPLQWLSGVDLQWDLPAQPLTLLALSHLSVL